MDENGFVSEEEFYSVRQQRMAARAAEGKKMRCAASAPSFSDLDVDSDGQLSQEELTTGQKAHHAKCMQGGRGHGHGQGEGEGEGYVGGMRGNPPAFSDLRSDSPAPQARPARSVTGAGASRASITSSHRVPSDGRSRAAALSRLGMARDDRNVDRPVKDVSA